MEQLKLDKVMISVVMSVYNESEEMLCQAIESILRQSYRNFEFIIIVDDPNNTKIIQLIKKYSTLNTKIKCLINKENIGLALSLNRGIKESSGQYIARMDADDISTEDRLKIELNYMLEHDLDMVFSARRNIDEEGKIISEYRPFFKNQKIIKNTLELDCIVTHPSVLIRTEVIKKMNGYRMFTVSQDYDLWLRLLSCGYKIGYIPECLIDYRIRSGALSQKKAFMQFETTRYIRKLYYERRRKAGIDSYSYEAYQKYLDKRGVFDKNVTEKYVETVQNFYLGITYLKEFRFKHSMIPCLKALKEIQWTSYFAYKIVRLKLVKWHF